MTQETYDTEEGRENEFIGDNREQSIFGSSRRIAYLILLIFSLLIIVIGLAIKSANSPDDKTLKAEQTSIENRIKN